MHHFINLNKFNETANPKIYLIANLKQTNTLFTDMAKASHSCQAIARVVHPKSYNQWSKPETELMVKLIKDGKIKVSSNEQLISVSIALGRSVCAIRGQHAKHVRTQKAVAVINMLSKAKTLNP